MNTSLLGKSPVFVRPVRLMPTPSRLSWSFYYYRPDSGGLQADPPIKKSLKDGFFSHIIGRIAKQDS